MTTRSNDTVWYFSYGSNLEPDRFRDRVCDFFDRQRAILSGYALRFSGEVTSDGGLDAEVYVVPTPRTYRAPSEKYVGHNLKGLHSFGYPESVLEEVRAAAAREPIECDAHPGRQDLRQ